MVKIAIDRDGCIGCGACWGSCPEVFESNADDAKSQIVGKYQVQGNSGEGEVGENLADCVRQAADGCPMQVIAVA